MKVAIPIILMGKLRSSIEVTKTLAGLPASVFLHFTPLRGGRWMRRMKMRRWHRPKGAHESPGSNTPADSRPRKMNQRSWEKAAKENKDPRVLVPAWATLNKSFLLIPSWGCFSICEMDIIAPPCRITMRMKQSCSEQCLAQRKHLVSALNILLVSMGCLIEKEWNNAIFCNMDGPRWHPTPVLLPGKSHGRRSLVGCRPWGHKESDTTERLHFHFSLSCIGEGNGKPLQCSCLENPRDRGAWWASVYGVAQSRTWLKRLSSSSSSRDCHTEWSKSDREGEISYNIPYMCNLKRNDTNELTYKTERDSQT